ncbi:MAG: TIGR01244 family phosphatase [Halioglobus sp.]|nr:TIGR01244 family phosphatase [Halioglobus sp.]
MRSVKLSDSVAVSAQIAPEHVAEIAAAGYKVLVNNRPDGEEPGQPSSAEMAARAAEAGLDYYHMPVTAGDFPGADFAAFRALLDDPGRPVFAYCRSGTRCANLWVASRAEGEVQAAADLAAGLGYDLGMAGRHLSRGD